MQATEFETDEMLKLLTEALRRGPGSPEWHHAIEKLRQSGATAPDDYRLLLDVRERLESGQSYREVRAGAEFTRELFEKIESSPDSRFYGRPRTALIVSLVCAGLLIVSLSVLVVMMANGGKNVPPGDRLANTLFITPVQQWTFASTMPEGLNQTGSLKLITQNGLRIGRDEKPGTATLAGIDRVDISDGLCIESQIQFQPGADVQIALGVGDLAPGGGSSELLVQLEDDGFSVVSTDVNRVKRALQAGLYTVRIKLDASHAMVEVDGQMIWSGPHEIGSPATSFLRFTKHGKKNGNLHVQSLRLLKP